VISAIRQSGLPWLFAWVAGLCLLAALAFFIYPAHAQSGDGAGEAALIKNTGQTPESFNGALNDQGKRGQGFTTGDHSGGYRLSSIGLRFHTVAQPAAGQDLTVKLRRETDDNPGADVCVLTKPDSIASDAVNSFGAPTDCGVLSASATYFVVVERSGTGAGSIGLRITTTGDEDADAASGWSVLDDRHWFDDGWGSTTGEAYLIEVRGKAVNSPATGLPAISGKAQVGEKLTAHTSGIADADGLTNVSYTYQWIANDGSADADIPGATASTYTLADGDAGKKIKVTVSFTDDADNEESVISAATAAVAATVPTKPLGLSVSKGSKIRELDVSWQAPSSNGGSAVTGYRVQWKEAADSWDTADDVSEATATGTSHTITGLTGGVAYTVRVIASNGAGDGPASGEESGTPAGGVLEQQEPDPSSTPAPTAEPTAEELAPSGLTAQVGDGGVSLSWDAPAEESGTVTGYRVLRAAGDGELTTLRDDTGNTTTTYTDATATEAGETYAYVVKALRGQDESQASNEAEVQIPYDPADLAPSNLSAEVVAAGVSLSWDAPADESRTVPATGCCAPRERRR